MTFTATSRTHDSLLSTHDFTLSRHNQQLKTTDQQLSYQRHRSFLKNLFFGVPMRIAQHPYIYAGCL